MPQSWGRTIKAETGCCSTIYWHNLMVHNPRNVGNSSVACTTVAREVGVRVPERRRDGGRPGLWVNRGQKHGGAPGHLGDAGQYNTGGWTGCPPTCEPQTMGRGATCQSLRRMRSTQPPTTRSPCVTFRLVVAPLRGPGRSPVLPFACCVGSLLSVGRCGWCSCWCRFRVRGAQ